MISCTERTETEERMRRLNFLNDEPWDEVNDDLDPKNYTIKNALDRMESMGEDPVLPVLTDKPKLAKTLARLDALLKG
jgi:hypothetical protein